ncbi:MAG: branched-chain amino acid ABC transporter permease [Marmoricola sp.]
MPSELANILVGTFTLGFVYGLVGLGFVAVFRSTGVMSFAQGSFMLIGALVFYSVTTDTWHLGPITGMLLTLAVLAVCGAATYQLVLGRILGVEPVTVSVATLGLSIVLQMVAFMIWTPNIVQFRSMLSFNGHELFANIRLSQEQTYTIVVGTVITAALVLVLGRTRVGLRMKAVAESPELAAYQGLNVRRLSMAAWGIGAATAGAAGVIFGMATQVEPGTLPAVGLLAFPAILLGGLDSIGGAVIGGFLVAAIQNITQVWIGSAWQDVICYSVLLIVMFIRPQGLFGTPMVARL